MEEEETASKSTHGGSDSNSNRNRKPCTLDKATKDLVDLIFNQDMFKEAMSDMNLDPAKLPLGALSQSQIRKGFDVLEEIEEEIGKSRPNGNRLTLLSSRFYTVIPHAFGRRPGPVLKTNDAVKEKYEMLNTLTDIETAQKMQQSSDGEEADEATKLPHPSDLNYEQLKADLSLLDTNTSEYQQIQRYFDETKSQQYCSMKLRNAWTVNRHKESEVFAEHDDLDNRKLLWHGTNVAVVAAILKSGLRIMPHSGGRVGRGIYLADQHEKSAGYVRGSQRTAIMFLVEAALGKMHLIQRDDSSLTKAPSGFDSVLAQGTKHSPKSVSMTMDGKTVAVPSGTPTQSDLSSSFRHNEFLIYKESQHRIRYVLAFDY